MEKTGGQKGNGGKIKYCMNIYENYKWSNYTYISKEGVYFNFLTGQMIWDKNNSLFQKEHIVLEKFIEKGFIVHKDTDEQALSKLKLGRNKYSSGLKLTIYPTERCNFRCTYCYEKFNDISMDETTENAIISFIRKNIRYYSSLEVTWFGGEPLLELDMIVRMSKKIVEICKNASRPYRASCITNGYLLTLGNVEELMRCHVYTYMITLDGPAIYHDKMRKRRDGGGTYERIFKNLKDIYLYSRTNLLRIKIRVNESPESLNILPDYLEFLEHEFGENKVFSFMFRPVGKWDIKGENDFESVEVGTIYRIISESKVHLNCVDHYLELCDSLCEASKVNGYIIRPNAEVCKCNLLIGEKVNVVGKISNQGEKWHLKKL